MELKTLLKNTKTLLAILNKYLKIAAHFINVERIKLTKKIRKEWNEYSDQLAYELVYYYEILKPKFADFRKNWKRKKIYFYYSKYAEIYVNEALTLIKSNIRWFFVSLAVLVMTCGFISSYDNRYHSILFYTDKKKDQLFAEKRGIIKSWKEIDRIKNSVEELLLGPVDPKLVSVFPKESRLLSAMLSNKTLILNFNKETIMDVNWEKNNGVSIYYLLTQSVADPVCFQFKEIEKIKFYFNGQDYRYIGDIGPVDDGVKPDWKILKK
jgi:hypothetical protein